MIPLSRGCGLMRAKRVDKHLTETAEDRKKHCYFVVQRYCNQNRSKPAGGNSVFPGLFPQMTYEDDIWSYTTPC